jgi:hypothetical protein
MNEPQESDERAFAERFRQVYERTSVPGAERRARIVHAVRVQRPGTRPGSRLEGWFEPRAFTMRPIVALALAIALVASGGLLMHRVDMRAVRRIDTEPGLAAARLTPAQPVRFVFVDRSASQVALVGDFNGWDAQVSPMRRSAADGIWTIEVPLSPGWHSYAFVVNGTTWRPDPQAPLAPTEDFGTPRSVVVVEEHGT